MIYISHSSLVNYKDFLYNPIKSSNLIPNYKFIFPHERDSEDLFDTKKLFLSGKCKLVLAEVSTPSTGQGIELGWANDLHIPIVCIYRKGSTITSALKTVSNKFIEYDDSEDMIQKIATHLSNGASKTHQSNELLSIIGELHDRK